MVNELPEKETQKFRQTRHSFVTFSLRRVLHKNPKKKNEKNKNKTWRTSLRERGVVGEGGSTVGAGGVLIFLICLPWGEWTFLVF